MAGKPNQDRYTIAGTPVTSGLDLSASRDVVDETQLWEVEGAFINEDKVLVKRPSFVQWGTQIIEPSPIVPDNDEMISKVFPINKDDWSEPVITGSSASISIDNGSLILSGWDSGGDDGTATITRSFLSGEQYNDNGGFGGDVFLSFVLHIKHPEAGNYAHIKFAVEEDVQKEIAINAAGIAIKTGVGTFATLNDTAVAVDGFPHRVDIYSAGGQSCVIDIDGTQVNSTAWTYVENTSDFFFEISAVSDDTLDVTPYAMLLSSLILKDEISSPYYTPSISDIHTVRALGTASPVDTHSLLAAGTKYLWLDYALREVWTPLYALPRDKVRFGKFRGNTIICNYGESSRKTEVYEYRDKTVIVLDQAPNIRFSTEFANRVWGSGDVNHPLRVYFSGDRQSNLWYNPDDPNVANTLDS